MFRRTRTEPTPAEPQPRAKPGGKGRPTPTRKEAEAARKAAFKKPANRREAAQQRRERARAERTKVHEAMRSGDDRYLPKGDKGPIRRFARDYVDVRWSVMEFALPLLVVVMLGSLLLANSPLAGSLLNLFFLCMLLASVIDWIVMTRGLKRELARRMPDAETRGVGFYAIRRTMQIRRWRLPKPTVTRGSKL